MSSEIEPFADALTTPLVLRPDESGEVVVELRPTWTRLHRQLPPTLMWGYGGSFPGPTIEVRRGQRIKVAWTNRIPKGSAYPVTAVEVEQSAGQAAPHNRPGREGAEPIKEVAALPAWSVTHLHGAQTGGGNDGWADNAVGFGDAQLSEYPNDHQATQYWYHDHAMNITRWNVYAGLVGTYLVRDDEEDALGLPSGARELPLILADRNLDQDEDGRLNGRLLHKTTRLVAAHPETGKPVSLPFLGPYTTVNGTIWPYADVEAGWYRFRLVNASNARVYDLVLVDEDDRPVTGVLHQIGSDGGLLPRPVAVDFGMGTGGAGGAGGAAGAGDSEGAGDADGVGVVPLTIAPAERFDLLVDFRQLAGRRLRLLNKAPGRAPGVADATLNVPYPQVMEFRVGEPAERGEEPDGRGGRGSRDSRDAFEVPPVLSGSFRRYDHAAVEHGHRLVVLTPPGTVGGGGHPEIWEMEEVPEHEQAGPRGPVNGVIRVQSSDGKVRTYRRTARTFNDGLGFTIGEGAYEQWSFLNLAPQTVLHPMHIHLADFQVMAREAYVPAGFDPAVGGTREPVRFDPERPVAVPPNEQGWKDVFRVPGGQLVRVMGRFDGAYGRFMYHCHLLEHEDMGMMRPFVVMPPEVLPLGHDHAGGPGHGH
ncbi:O-aminophenol oxidase PhsA [Streptomyces sp. NPDC048717]|uniref:O-aminophenol oxidase PhsA n=1 Tax=Streptomyces sp. NPDC048717 TaxID=3154928 RepID=UPI003439B80C